MRKKHIAIFALSSLLAAACDPKPTGDDTTPPGFPTGLSAARNGDAVEIAWTMPSDGDLGGALLLRRADVEPDTAPTTGQSYQVGDVIGLAAVVYRGHATSNTYVDTPPSPGRYCYRVYAFDTSFNYSGSASRCVDFLEEDTTPPTFDGLVSATGVSNTQIELLWEAATDDQTDAADLVYDVYQAEAETGISYATPTHTTGGGATSLTVFGLQPGTTYYFVVRARDLAGNRDNNQLVRAGTTQSNADTTPPTFGGLVSATTVSGARIDLAWTAASDDTTAAADLVYDIYQAAASGSQSYGTPSYTTAPGITSFSVTGLSPSTTYYFVVRARDEAGNQDGNTVEHSATTSATADTTPPTFAGLVSATAAGETQINLTWAAASDDISASGDVVYLIYQSTASGGQNYAAPSYVTAAGATSFPVTGLSPGTTYYFVVRARDEANNVDGNTVERSATTPASGDVTPPTFAGLVTADAVTETQILLTWADASDNVTGPTNMVYLVYQASTSGGQSFGTPTYTTTAGATSYLVTGLAPATAYYFVVRARDQAGNNDTNTVQRSATTLSGPDSTPPNFTGVITATAASSSAIDLTWNAAVDNVTPAAGIVYDIYFATSAGAQNFAVPNWSTGAGATSYRVTGLAASTTYYFVVRARDASGNRDVNLIERSATTQITDVTPPLIVSDNFATGGALVSGTTGFVASVTFSEPVTGMNATNVTINNGATLGSFATSDSITWNFTASGLQNGVRYTVSLTSGIEDQSGNPLAPTSREIYVAATVLYVRPGGAGIQNGTSPTNALPLVSQALSLAAPGTDIYVQGGTYSDSITLVEGVNIYGAYDASFTVRDPVNNETLLTQAAFSTTVTVGAGLTTSTVIDGMAFTNTYTGARAVLRVSGGAGVTVRSSRLFLGNIGCYAQEVVNGTSGTANSLVMERCVITGGGMSNSAYCARESYGIYWSSAGSFLRLDGNTILGGTSLDTYTGYEYYFYAIRMNCHTCEVVNNVINARGSGPTATRYSYGIYHTTNAAYRKLAITNNTLSGGEGSYRYAIVLAGAIDALHDVRIANNVLFTNVGGSNSYAINRTTTTGIIKRVENNLFTNAGTYLNSGTAYTTLSSMETYLTGVGTVAALNKEVTTAADLYFQDYAAGDWRPTASSPLGLTQGGRDTSGDDWGAATTDRLGNPRTLLFSIGAYEQD